MSAPRAASSDLADEPAPVTLVGEGRIDGEGAQQQRAASAADQDRAEAHGGSEPAVDATYAAEGGEFLHALAQPVGRAGEAARPEGARVQGGDLRAVLRQGRADDDVMGLHHVSLLGAPPRISPMRRRAPLLAASGRASAAKKPCSRISMLGGGTRSCFQSRTTNRAM